MVRADVRAGRCGDGEEVLGSPCAAIRECLLAIDMQQHYFGGVSIYPPKKETLMVEPTGLCFCGCGGATSPKAHFIASHDRRAETRVIKAEYGSIADFVVAHGYGPEHPDGGGPR